MTGEVRPDPFRTKPLVGRIPGYTFPVRRGRATVDTGAPGNPWAGQQTCPTCQSDRWTMPWHPARDSWRCVHCHTYFTAEQEEDRPMSPPDDYNERVIAGYNQRRSQPGDPVGDWLGEDA